MEDNGRMSHKGQQRLRSSRQRYLAFVEDYKRRRLEDTTGSGIAAPEPANAGRGKRREYIREYIRWLWPYRSSVFAFFALALGVAGLQMVEPLLMRFIIDRVLLNTTLDRI